MTSEPTLGQLRNRIAAMFADKSFKPDIPLSHILAPEEIRALFAALKEGE